MPSFLYAHLLDSKQDASDIQAFSIQNDGGLIRLDHPRLSASWGYVEGSGDKVAATAVVGEDPPTSSLTIYQVERSGILSPRVRGYQVQNAALAGRVVITPPPNSSGTWFFFTAPYNPASIPIYKYSEPDTIAHIADAPAPDGLTIIQPLAMDTPRRLLYCLGYDSKPDNAPGYIVSYFLTGFGTLTYRDKVQINGDIPLSADSWNLSVDPTGHFLHLSTRSYPDCLCYKVKDGYFSPEVVFKDVFPERALEFTMVTSMDGRYLAVGGSEDDVYSPHISAYAIDPDTGEPKKINQVDSEGRIAMLVRGFGGKYIYASHDHGITGYRLDSAGLTPITTVDLPRFNAQTLVSVDLP